MKKRAPYFLAALFFASGLVLNQGAIASEASQGKQVYANKCALCHGPHGKGHGMAASAYKPPPTDFTKAAFWKEKRIDKLIADTIKHGKGQMPPIAINEQQIKEVTAYLKHAFKPAK